MKTLVLACAVMLGGLARAQPLPPVYQDADPAAIAEFRIALGPYGLWLDDATYGTVWVPHRQVVGAGFVPYVTAGHWTYDEDGYVWISDYPWGWAPFHYGRWVVIPRYGWAWIPGRQYAGAWVDWRIGNDRYDYVGWAPTPPTWIWRHDRAVRLGYPQPQRFVYVPHRNLFDGRIHGSIAHGPVVPRIERNTREYTRHGAPTNWGPPPNSFGRQRVPVVRPPANDRGLDRARRFSRPQQVQPPIRRR